MAAPKITKAKLGDKPQSILFYGPAGCGKTHLAGTIAKVKGFDSVKVFDLDRSAGVLADVAPEAELIGFDRGDIAGFETYWRTYCKAGGNGADVTILDTGTVLQQWKLESLSKGLGWDRIDMVTKFICDVLWDLHDLPGLGIAIFHAEIGSTIKGASADSNTYVPALQGKAVKTLIPAIPDIIGFLSDDGEDRILTLRSDEEALAKNRFNKLPDSMSNPDMKRMYDYLSGKLVKKSQ